MKIGLIGLGVVGSACKYGFEKIGHIVYVHDTKFDTKITDLLFTDVIFICVPTPSNDDGSCNVEIVESVVYQLNDLNYRGIVAIKSTVKPTTTKRLQEETNLKICFVPEFLRERCAISDFVENHDLLAIGTDDPEIFQLIKESHGNYPKKTVQLSSTEAELLKYYSNTFNATKIIFANEMYEICSKVDANYSKIKDAFVKRGTAKDIYLDVNENFRGYGGLCLPKDTKAMDAFVRELGLDLKLFKMIDLENKKFKKTVIDGMRIE